MVTLKDFYHAVKLVKALFGIDVKLNDEKLPYVPGISFPIGLN